MTDGQSLALEQLEAVADSPGDGFEVLEHRLTPGGTFQVDIAIACHQLPHAPGGVHLRSREEFTLSIGSSFPFSHPVVETRHTRFAGHPHVQWNRHLCLYAAPSVEWTASDGMFGLLTRLWEWLTAASLNELDPEGAPLHPPVAYPTSGECVVIRVDTPTVSATTWFGSAHLARISPERIDLTGWSQLFDPTPRHVAAAILLTEPMPFEYPKALRALLDVMEQRGVSRESFMQTLRLAVLQNDSGTPLYVVIGTPMRGIKGSGAMRQHLLIWRISSAFADGLRLSLEQFSPHPEIRAIGDRVMTIMWEWAETAIVEWCAIYEARPEVTVRRDSGSAASSFHAKCVSVWGCGALGGHIAEWLVRSGVRRIILRDDKPVTPGILVRQTFEDSDIGHPKALALADRLKRINPNQDIEFHNRDLIHSPLDETDWTDSADLVIDTTGTNSVLTRLEQRRREASEITPILVSMTIDARAERGLVVVAGPGHSGGPYEVLRAAKLMACSRPELERFANAFWPRDRAKPFFPEPGCSSPTFVGSVVDVVGLAAIMANAVAGDLTDQSFSAGRVHFAALAGTNSPSHLQYDIHPSIVAEDDSTGYQTRIALPAWKEMRGWIARCHRTLGPLVETGGVLFGTRDDVLKVVWIDEAIGPPPDSESSESGFVCGTAGVNDVKNEKVHRSRELVRFVGLWHTHPGAMPAPSQTDFQGMRQLVASADPNTPRALMLIVGGDQDYGFMFGARLFRRTDFQSGAAYSTQLRVPIIPGAGATSDVRIGLALSGGGSRAIAFHLGCLRGLHDRGVLDRVNVLSAVSGGSILAAMYAYSHDTFEGFDQRVVAFLRRGLLGAIARRALGSSLLLGTVGTMAAAGSAALIADALRSSLTAGASLLGPLKARVTPRLHKIQPPLRRWISRTTALEKALHEELFANIFLNSQRRGNLHVIFNACELRSGSAFRFGSRESGCWRYGQLADNAIPVSTAVAASAAYPILLPALDLEMDFITRQGAALRQRVLLTDGGVYDNLGITCLEPDQSDAYGYNVFPVDYLFSCDAGHGLFDTTAIPYSWGARVSRSFESVFRKNHNAAHGRLHRHGATGALKGFVLAYLGQQDKSLPYIPADLVQRKAIYGYPTDFAPMAPDDLDRMAARGERLIRLLVDRYCPEV